MTAISSHSESPSAESLLSLSLSSDSDMFTSQDLHAQLEPGVGIGGGDPSLLGAAEHTCGHEFKVDDAISINSFVPVLESLESPGLVIINGVYHLRGTISKDEEEKLCKYTRRVTKFTLTENVPAIRIDAGTWFRMLQLQSRHSQGSSAFFPSLVELCIDGANSSLEQASLFMGPALDNIKISNIPPSQSDALITFLHNLVEAVPHLSSLSCDSSVSFNSFQEICKSFIGLRTLNLCVSPGAALSESILREIGMLPELESLFLDASHATYGPTHYPQDRSPQPIYERAPSPGPTIGCHSPSWESHWGVPDSSYPQPCESSRPVSPNCPALERSSSPAPSLDPISTEENYAPDSPSPMGLEDEAEAPSVYRRLRVLDVHGQLELMKDIASMVSSPTMRRISFMLTSPTSGPVATVNKKKKKSTVKTSPAPPAPDNGFDNHISNVLATWRDDLKSITLANPTNSLALSSAVLKRILCLPSLEHLDISGCTLERDYALSFNELTTMPVDQPSKLATLHLPTNSNVAQGISLKRLQTVVMSCPSLVSLKCGLKNLSNIPPLPAMRFGLRTLIAGNPTPYGEHHRLVEVAQYLDAIFPNLETMESQTDCNAGEWDTIFDMIRMCQKSRIRHAEVPIHVA